MSRATAVDDAIHTNLGNLEQQLESYKQELSKAIMERVHNTVDGIAYAARDNERQIHRDDIQRCKDESDHLLMLREELTRKEHKLAAQARRLQQIDIELSQKEQVITSEHTQIHHGIQRVQFVCGLLQSYPAKDAPLLADPVNAIDNIVATICSLVDEKCEARARLMEMASHISSTECNICHWPAENPALLSCGHAFCTECIGLNFNNLLARRLGRLLGDNFHRIFELSDDVLGNVYNRIISEGFDEDFLFSYPCPDCSCIIKSAPISCERLGAFVAKIDEILPPRWRRMRQIVKPRLSTDIFRGLFLETFFKGTDDAVED